MKKLCKCGEYGLLENLLFLFSTLCLCSEPEWEFMKPLDDVEAVEREKAMFECDVSDPEAEVTWWRGDKVHHSLLLLSCLSVQLCILFLCFCWIQKLSVYIFLALFDTQTSVNSFA